MYRHRLKILTPEELRDLENKMLPADMCKFGSRVTMIMVLLNLLRLNNLDESMKKGTRIRIIQQLAISLALVGGARYFENPTMEMLRSYKQKYL